MNKLQDTYPDIQVTLRTIRDEYCPTCRYHDDKNKIVIPPAGFSITTGDQYLSED